ncbi:MAG TPA: hypothetical protein DCM27_02170 [Rhodospirillaceae bacterium]|nr:hypothetical protein [Rhodospirillaceae bacterium]
MPIFPARFRMIRLLGFRMEQNQNQTLPPKKAESRVFSYIRTCFLTGILVTAPVALSLYIVWSILIWVDETVGHILPIHLMGEDSIPGLGIIAAVGFFILVGWFARNFIGALMLRAFDYILERLPLVKTVYNALKQVFEMLMGKQAQAFREVVMVQFPRDGSWVVGFLAGKTEGEFKDALGETYYNVFVPTTPNPTSGFLILSPEHEIKRVNMTVDEGLKAIVSCGLIMPKSTPPK